MINTIRLPSTYLEIKLVDVPKLQASQVKSGGCALFTNFIIFTQDGVA